MISSEARLRIAKSILDFEARRDKDGHLAVYELPEGDGGGRYEVAGINDKYHPEEAAMLADLVRRRRFDEAEQRAVEIIATFTDAVTTWSSVTAVESYLRDSAFNRGPRGAARILQRALGVDDDGVVGQATRAALAQAERAPGALLGKLRVAREQYERDVAHRDESSKFWKGLVKRWNKALQFAMTFLDEPGAAPEAATAGAAFSAADAVVAALTGGGGTAVAAAAPAAAPPPPPPSAPSGAEPAPDGFNPAAPVALPALRNGSRGALVRAWQAFLAGQRLDPGGQDGVFGDKTAAATAEFQRRNGLAADGIAGRQTLLEAMALGFELIEEPAADDTGSNFPPRPDFPPLVGTAGRQAVFGRFDYVADPAPDNRERIRILGGWEAQNIVRVDIPQLRRALGSGAPGGMRFHRLAAGQLAGLWEDWERAGLLDRILSYDGAFVPRFIRGSTTVLSNHAFGTAFDINADLNGLGVRPPLVGQRGCVRELVPIAHRWGFYWGGHFGSRPDGMHFEIAVLKP